MHGFSHPFSGLDHILAMVAVGLYAAHLGGRSIRLVPLTFMAMMAVGGAIGAVGISMPFVEIGIALSIIVLGAAVAVPLNLLTAAAMCLVGFFALFHGHAHGAEMPLEASGLEFGLGFVLATGILHLIGIGLGSGLVAERCLERLAQVSGAGIAIAGFLLLVRIL
jgi:urease accessory protein